MRCFLAKEKALSKELEHRAETSVVYFNDRLGVKREIQSDAQIAACQGEIYVCARIAEEDITGKWSNGFQLYVQAREEWAPALNVSLSISSRIEEFFDGGYDQLH